MPFYKMLAEHEDAKINNLLSGLGWPVAVNRCPSFFYTELAFHLHFQTTSIRNALGSFWIMQPISDYENLARASRGNSFEFNSAWPSRQEPTEWLARPQS